MPKVVTRFSANVGNTLLCMDLYYGHSSGRIRFYTDGTYNGTIPPGLPFDIWLRCLYRFNRVVSQMIKPIEDGTEENSSI